MSYNEKLQRAVELTIAAGYQLSKEAFDFLNTAAATEDPVEIISKALHEMESLRDKPLIIEKGILEGLVKKPEAFEQALAQTQMERSIEQQPGVSEGRRLFKPYAKEVEPNIHIIENFSGNTDTSGSMEDYLRYFQDRFKRIEKLLRQRIDVKSATSVIEALKAPPNTKLKIIGMIAEKREQKQKIFLTVEDMTASATVLVPQNAPQDLLNKARMLLPDMVICISVTKARSHLLIADDIILPDV
ncbi:MAG: hypothetical protein QXQ63_03570, partial [Candidatus Bathyarchaeia archaeon]